MISAFRKARKSITIPYSGEWVSWSYRNIPVRSCRVHPDSPGLLHGGVSYRAEGAHIPARVPQAQLDVPWQGAVVLQPRIMSS